ncbi:diaminopimelate decarboxylase [bacterium]|nr:diaminopimelate decarboxylase [bacterium]
MGFKYVGDELICDGIAISSIVREVDTPFYLYSSNQITENFNSYKEGFAALNPLICYACKANTNLAVLKLLANLGSGADILSYGELFKVLAAGIQPGRIVFNGNGKTKEELIFGLDNEILMFNVDSKDEILLLNQLAKERGKKARVALRVNPDIDPGTHPKISTALAKSKFGIGLSLAKEGYRFALSLSNIEVVGIHAHIGSQITKIAPFIESLKKLVQLAKELKNEGVGLEYLNLGGGLGIAYLDETPPLPSDLAGAISPIFEESSLRLILEPGRSIVGKAGIMVTKVLYVKEGSQKNFIVVDAGMNDFIRPTLYGGYHRIIPVNRKKGEEIAADVVGPICEEGDFLGRERKMVRPSPGDYLSVLDAGAYGCAMSSTYNSRLLPAEVMTYSNNYHLIRHRQSYEDLISLERIPEALLLR